MTIEVEESVNSKGKRTYNIKVLKNTNMNRYVHNYDKHTLLINFEYFSEFREMTFSEIQDKLKVSFNEFLLEYNPNIECEFYFNILTRGSAYVFITNKSVYEHLINIKRDWNRIRMSNLTPKINDIELKLQRVSVDAVDDKRMSNVLRSKKLHSSITEEDLFSLFAPFANDSTTLQTRYIKNVKVLEPYPFISIDENRVAFIVFDPNRLDAQFALLFNKYITVKKDNEIIKLEFEHSFRAERDIITEINKRNRNN